MKAVVLAAGEGTRMRPLTYTCPKPLLPVMGKPVLRHILEGLKKSGVNEVLLVVGSYTDLIMKEIGEVGLKLDYVIQKKPLGTAHALGLAEDFVNGDSFLLVNGDVLVPEDVYRHVILLFHREGSHVVSLARVDDVSNYGLVKVEDGRIVQIIEKPRKKENGLVNAGIYMFSNDIFKEIKKTPLSKRGEYELTDTIQLMINQGAYIIPYEIKDWWVDLGYPWDLLLANELLMKSKVKELIIHEEAQIEREATIHSPVHIGEKTTVKAGTYIEGPVYIGRECIIGPNCYIRPYTSIGNHCHIGNACEVKKSIIMDGTNVAHLSYVGDSIIGRNVNLGAGTITANLRLDEKNVKATVKGKKIDTGMRKMGAVIGENVKIGIGAMLMPGVMIGPNTLIGPGVILTEDVPKNSSVFIKQRVEIIK